MTKTQFAILVVTCLSLVFVTYPAGARASSIAQYFDTTTIMTLSGCVASVVLQSTDPTYALLDVEQERGTTERWVLNGDSVANTRVEAEGSACTTQRHDQGLRLPRQAGSDSRGDRPGRSRWACRDCQCGPARLRDGGHAGRWATAGLRRALNAAPLRRAVSEIESFWFLQLRLAQSTALPGPQALASRTRFGWLLARFGPGGAEVPPAA